MADRVEQQGGGRTTRKAVAPEARRFLQIKTVVLMSDAWRDCDYSARAAYVELSASLQWVSGKSDPINNGRIWISREAWEKSGFAAATITRAMKQLIKVGLIYRTRTGGIGRGCSEYALTCFPLTRDTSGLFCKAFVKDAWAKYVAPSAQERKNRVSKLNRNRFTSDELPRKNCDYRIKSEPTVAIKNEHQESESTNLQGSLTRTGGYDEPRPPSLATTLLIRRGTTMDRGRASCRHFFDDSSRSLSNRKSALPCLIGESADMVKAELPVTRR